MYIFWNLICSLTLILNVLCEHHSGVFKFMTNNKIYSMVSHRSHPNFRH